MLPEVRTKKVGVLALLRKMLGSCEHQWVPVGIVVRQHRAGSPLTLRVVRCQHCELARRVPM